MKLAYTSFLMWTLLEHQKAKCTCYQCTSDLTYTNQEIILKSYSRYYVSTDRASEESAWLFFREFRIREFYKYWCTAQNLHFRQTSEIQLVWYSNKECYSHYSRHLSSSSSIPATGIVTNVLSPCLPMKASLAIYILGFERTQQNNIYKPLSESLSR